MSRMLKLSAPAGIARDAPLTRYGLLSLTEASQDILNFRSKSSIREIRSSSLDIVVVVVCGSAVTKIRSRDHLSQARHGRDSQYYYHTFLSAPSLALESTRSSESQDLSRFTWVVLQLRSLGNW